MMLLLLGLLMLGLKVGGMEPIASLSWWWVSVPFALTVLWWSFSDYSGLTQRWQMRRVDEEATRRRRRREALLRPDKPRSH